MHELLRRLGASPLITAELLVATLFVNLLALAMPLFVIQVLNRYVSYGMDSTLAALTSGVVLAILLEFAFRQARQRLAAVPGALRGSRLAAGAFGILTGAKPMALERLPLEQRQEAMRGIETVESAYHPHNLLTLLDLPFSLIFVSALFLLHHQLGMIGLLFLAAALLLGLAGQRLLRGPMAELARTNAEGGALAAVASRSPETLRAFDTNGRLGEAWQTAQASVAEWRARIANRQGATQGLANALQALLGVAIYTIGAVLAVRGELDVGTLIGANILASRALAAVTRATQLGEGFARARQALQQLQGFAALEQERSDGTLLTEFRGGIELRDLAFQYPGTPAPLFEGLNLRLAPGSVLVVTGNNGSGKSTLARLLLGLVEPVRGQLLADGVELRQLHPAGWRRQVEYLPQEPWFLPGSIRDNLLAANPDLDDEGLGRVVAEAGLADWLALSPQGLDTPLRDGGQQLALGIRRRLALARALAGNGALVLFDEPTEGLDRDGCNAVYAALKRLSEQGRTIVLCTHDPVLQGAATLLLDLNAKPVPLVVRK